MKIIIESIPHDLQRYPTAGDYLTINDTSYIKVSSMKDWRYEALVAIHELIEMTLCKVNHIEDLDIDHFDKHFAGIGEPGDDNEAPYYFEHQIATGVERMLAALLDVDWYEYNQAIEKL